MNCSKKLNANAASVNFEISRPAAAFREFFNLLFVSWKTANVDSIISRVPLETVNDADEFFRELFVNIYNLSLKSETNLNADNVICAINTIDTTVPEVLIFESDVPESILVEYQNVKERAFQECFKRIRVSFKLLREINNKSSGSQAEMNRSLGVFNNMANEIRNVLLVLSRLSKVKYFPSYLHKFSAFLWDLYNEYTDLLEMRHSLLFALSNISDQLFTFLMWKIDCENNAAAGMLALEIFNTLKFDLINSKFSAQEISYVLNILDQHDRFIGQFVDAVPENGYEDGYVFGFSMARSMETDEVYEDYEKFLLNEFD